MFSCIVLVMDWSYQTQLQDLSNDIAFRSSSQCFCLGMHGLQVSNISISGYGIFDDASALTRLIPTHNFDTWSLDTRYPHSWHSTGKLQIENSPTATLEKIFNWIKHIVIRETMFYSLVHADVVLNDFRKFHSFNHRKYMERFALITLFVISQLHLEMLPRCSGS